VVTSNAVPNFEPDRLRQLRQEAGLTQERLAFLAGVPPQTIVQYENRHRGPSAGRLAALARALGARPSDLTASHSRSTLAQLRIEAGLNQQETAATAGLTRTRYSALERGETATLDPQIVVRLAAALKVTEAQVRAAHSHARAHHLSSGP
jgi:transcriptional regulator with XRE-family HTH domain